MNNNNVRRRRESEEKIEKAFMELLESKELEKVTVSDICKVAKINRSTFYANYIDVYDLADKFKERLYESVKSLRSDVEFKEVFYKYGFMPLLQHIKDNQDLYKTFYKLAKNESLQEFFEYSKAHASYYFNDEHIDYHITFFKNGFNSVIKMWLDRDCAETPQEISDIIEGEFGGRELPK